MKRIYFTLLVIIAVSLLTWGQTTPTQTGQQKPDPPNIEMRFASPIKGWVVTEETLQGYEIGIDVQTKHGGKASAFARSNATGAIGVAVLRQSVSADQYRGHRVRFSGWVKAQEVVEWAGLWLRIDGEQGVRLSLDNMQNRPLKGTGDWRQYELVLNVPDNAIAVSFGLVLVGKGQVWMDDLQLEQAPPESVTTVRYGKSVPRPDDDEYNRRREALAKRLLEELKAKPLQPVNVDFENPLL